MFSPDDSPLRTGIEALDAVNGGLQSGDLAALASPGRDDARALAERAAVEVGSQGRAAIINVEEHWSTVRKRLAGIPQGAEALERRSITVPHMPSSSVRPVLEEVRHCIVDARCDLVVIHAVDLVTVDYAGGIHAESAGHVTRTCKTVAKDYGAAVLLICGMRRGSQWPTLGDLPADALEADADVVLLLHRKRASVNRVEVRLAKNRHDRLDPATQGIYAAH